MVDILPPGVVVEGEGAIRYRFNQRDLLVAQETFMEAEGDWVLQAEFVYDGEANRLQQIDHTDATPITTTYTNDVVGLSQVLVSSNGVTTTHHLFGLDLIHVDDGSATRTVLGDGLGNGRIEMVGSAVETATTYEPYGKVLAQTGASGTVYGFTGEQYDILTSLMYLRARYYSPSLKIFLSRDPFPGIPTMPASQHGYSYVHNNPVNMTDPSGEIAPLVILGLIGSGLIIGKVAAFAWDVMVVQGRGGIDNVLSGALLNPCHWENVNWEQAKFTSDIGAFVGMFAAPGIYVAIHPIATYHAASSGLASAGRWAVAHGTSAVSQAPRLARGLQTLGKIYSGFETASDGLTIARGFLSNDPQAKFDAATTLFNPATGVRLFGFRGTGKTAEEFIDTDPLIYAGHVGVSFDEGKTIYGFTPYAPELSNREAIDALKNHQIFPGQVLNDVSVFHRAQDLAEQGYRTQVYVMPIDIPEGELRAIQQSIFSDVKSSPLSNKSYTFPGPPGCFNCATYPSSVGLPIPEESGNIVLYINAMKKLGAVPWRRGH